MGVGAGEHGRLGDDASLYSRIIRNGPCPQSYLFSPMRPRVSDTGILGLLDLVPDPRARRGVRHRLTAILSVRWPRCVRARARTPRSPNGPMSRRPMRLRSWESSDTSLDRERHEWTAVAPHTLDGQHDALNAAGVDRIFDDVMSGARSDRPGLAAALDRLGRSLLTRSSPSTHSASAASTSALREKASTPRPPQAAWLRACSRRWPSSIRHALIAELGLRARTEVELEDGLRDG